MRRSGRRRSLPGEELELVEGFGELVREARIRLGLTQEDLAKQLNEKVAVIKKIESEQFRPSIDLARKLEKALKIRILAPAEEELESVRKFMARGAEKGISLGDLLKKKGLTKF